MYKPRSKATAESKAKAKFRQTAKWKNFRKLLKKKRKVDFVTQKPLIKGFQLHHANMQLGMYNVLEEENFFCVNRTTHEIIHWGFRYSWEFIIIQLIKVWLKMDQLNNRKKTEGEKKMDEFYQDLIAYSDKFIK